MTSFPSSQSSYTTPDFKYCSTKVFDGFSTCFRQWRAEKSHCRFLHGYSLTFKIWFVGELDEKDWIWDFGGMKRSTNTIDGMSPQDWLKYMFDHTLLIAEDDPHLDDFRMLADRKLAQLRVLPSVSAEKFAELIFVKMDEFVYKETGGRARVKQVDVREHDKNSAIAMAVE